MSGGERRAEMEARNEIRRFIRRMKKIARTRGKVLRYRIGCEGDGVYNIFLDMKERGAEIADASMES